MYIKTITDYLDITAHMYPDKIGVKDPNRFLTFSEIRKDAIKLATILASKNLFKKPVAIYLDKSVECFVSIFGVAYSGNFYTIVDVSMPKSRVKKIFNILEPELIITDKNILRIFWTFVEIVDIYLSIRYRMLLRMEI